MSSVFAQHVEPDLTERAAGGDMTAHAELFRRFGDAVFTLARRLVRRADVAEEILQETFLDAMRHIGSYRHEAPFGFWLRRIAVNRCLMFHRSRWERQVDGLKAEPIDEIDGLDMALQRIDLLALLERLPSMSRTVLWLHDVEGYTHEEIGVLFGRTASFSKSQLARSHARLRALAGSATSSEEVPTCTPTSAS